MTSGAAGVAASGRDEEPMSRMNRRLPERWVEVRLGGAAWLPLWPARPGRPCAGYGPGRADGEGHWRRWPVGHRMSDAVCVARRGAVTPARSPARGRRHVAVLGGAGDVRSHSGPPLPGGEDGQVLIGRAVAVCCARRRRGAHRGRREPCPARGASSSEGACVEGPRWADDAAWPDGRKGRFTSQASLRRETGRRRGAAELDRTVRLVRRRLGTSGQE